ncbi:MAG TPA: hypothetical protein RMH85_03010 [Polyangiaceae bacterium LLY-WYZ-15_(1-7)]|nr:hypothetical protein [Polyangiaceae bacterium LLY-WYZ-15_(1-7)]HJL04651.1 hypothetical protein [Polyangiaceae bacterium LLY-WYZ-15_(1-7)]HJL07433.1 hypothetical protein [Polyangiaceae bacterium LLY-WYZ-15_(1-7)]HJL22199.1 hypothetical protein [Polyangiaceae bacterium LLY-WYZ-15_(1-7)]HJL28103.1 hypothetical protein [Polyangiaceae bacterium LLY-WYZ-15_(1-7)]
MAELLAVDLGLRMGHAVFDASGALLRFGSQNVGSVTRLKRAAFRMVGEVDELAALVVEGDAQLGRPWLKAAERRGARTFAIHAQTWRPELLRETERRSGAEAKQAADGLARALIAERAGKGATSLRHDAAEAILIGWWGCLQLGWVEPDATPAPR